MTLVTIERDGPVAVITYNAPERRNAWNEAMHIAYLDALEETDRDAAVRAIVVTGAGDCFSAGADFARLRDIAANGWTPYRDSRPTSFPLGLTKPLIGAVNGPAVGMGLVNAMYCDLRILSESATLTAGFGRLGLVAEHGLSWLVPAVAGLSVANELLLSSRAMTAARAHQLGLAIQVEPTGDEAVAAAVRLGHEFSVLSPKALAATKTQLVRHSSTRFREAMEETQLVMRRSLAGDDFKDGLAAVLDKREVTFSNDDNGAYVADLRDHLL